MTSYLFGTAKAPGTCGELVEGTIDGREFLITCPIDMWSEITVKSTQEDTSTISFSKIGKAIGLSIKKWGKEKVNFEFTRKSSLLVGKGMGSSTADIAAAVQAVARALGYEATSEEIANIALEIEPSDATMYPGIYLFDHINGSIREPLGEPKINIEIVVMDLGGEVDTIQFNSRKNLKELNLKKEHLVKKAAKLVIDGLKENDPEKIGEGASISSLANQEILPKPELETILAWSKEIKALGVNVAHSGTVAGMLLSPELTNTEEVLEFIRTKRPDWNSFATRLIGGGVL